MSICEIRQYISSILCDKKMLRVGRSTDLIWVIFGKKDDTLCCEDTENIDEYSLHIQCTSRIVKNGIIVLGNTDIYCAGEGANSIINPSEVGVSIFDQRVQYFNGLLPLAVTSVDLAENGDIKIMLQDGFLFEVFVVGAMPGEFWRVFQRGNLSSHHVYQSETRFHT